MQRLSQRTQVQLSDQHGTYLTMSRSSNRRANQPSTTLQSSNLQDFLHFLLQFLSRFVYFLVVFCFIFAPFSILLLLSCTIAFLLLLAPFLGFLLPFLLQLLLPQFFCMWIVTLLLKSFDFVIELGDLVLQLCYLFLSCMRGLCSSTARNNW
ncbi:hypothetical protein F5I97DRAFT_1887253 [Phlebopus sp. FC_14]|nr:hypothetical protein F5I97DRAFT_1887253 [Phlebopus sp. FC_14]